MSPLWYPLCVSLLLYVRTPSSVTSSPQTSCSRSSSRNSATSIDLPVVFACATNRCAWETLIISCSSLFRPLIFSALLALVVIPTISHFVSAFISFQDSPKISSSILVQSQEFYHLVSVLVIGSEPQATDWSSSTLHSCTAWFYPTSRIRATCGMESYFKSCSSYLRPYLRPYLRSYR